MVGRRSFLTRQQDTHLLNSNIRKLLTLSAGKLHPVTFGYSLESAFENSTSPVRAHCQNPSLIPLCGLVLLLLWLSENSKDSWSRTHIEDRVCRRDDENVKTLPSFTSGELAWEKTMPSKWDRPHHVWGPNYLCWEAALKIRFFSHLRNSGLETFSFPWTKTKSFLLTWVNCPDSWGSMWCFCVCILHPGLMSNSFSLQPPYPSQLSCQLFLKFLPVRGIRSFSFHVWADFAWRDVLQFRTLCCKWDFFI